MLFLCFHGQTITLSFGYMLVRAKILRTTRDASISLFRLTTGILSTPMWHHSRLCIPHSEINGTHHNCCTAQFVMYTGTWITKFWLTCNHVKRHHNWRMITKGLRFITGYSSPCKHCPWSDLFIFSSKTQLKKEKNKLKNSFMHHFVTGTVKSKESLWISGYLLSAVIALLCMFASIDQRLH